MKILNLYVENLRISMRSIRANMVRAILTMLIIGFGIMALVGILTAIDAIRNSITDEFSRQVQTGTLAGESPRCIARVKLAAYAPRPTAL